MLVDSKTKYIFAVLMGSTGWTSQVEENRSIIRSKNPYKVIPGPMSWSRRMVLAIVKKTATWLKPVVWKLTSRRFPTVERMVIVGKNQD